MKMIIDIPESVYNQIVEEDLGGIMANAIKHGTPLPKGHGALIDRDWLDDNCELHFSDKDGSSCYSWRDINDAPTIIDADKGEEKI